MSSEQKGNEYIAEAEKKIKSSEGFFGNLFGGQAKLEEAADYYVSAGNSFKMAKKWTAAGNAFSEAAKLHMHRLQSKHNAATNYVEAANCHKKGDSALAIECLQQAIELFTEMGRFTMAAKHHVSIAELYETALLDIDKAMENYEQAADYYKGEDSSSSANKCLLKVALFSAQQENYQKAINIYEEVAANSLESPLLKYSAKDYFFRSLLCHMCVDTLEAQRALERYAQMYPAFEDAREYKLIKKLGEAMEEDNVEGFTEAVREYDSISRLDQWYTTILLRIKKTMAEEPGLT